MGLFSKDIATMDDLFAARPEGHLLRRKPNREIAAETDRSPPTAT